MQCSETIYPMRKLDLLLSLCFMKFPQWIIYKRHIYSAENVPCSKSLVVKEIKTKEPVR